MDVSPTRIRSSSRIKSVLNATQFLFLDVLQGMRAISGNRIKIYAWQSGAPTAVLYLFGPEHLGGPGDLRSKFAEVKADSEESRKEEIIKVRF